MSRYALGIDIGGTFTDVVLYDREQGRRLTRKALTTPGDPAEAVLDAVDQVLRDEAIPSGEVERVVHATTLFTNALIEHKGARTALLTTDGFRDSLEIGRERKYDLYDLAAKNPAKQNDIEHLTPRKILELIQEKEVAVTNLLGEIDALLVEK